MVYWPFEQTTLVKTLNFLLGHGETRLPGGKLMLSTVTNGGLAGFCIDTGVIRNGVI